MAFTLALGSASTATSSTLACCNGAHAGHRPPCPLFYPCAPQPPRNPSPTRRLASLTTSDIRGATVRPRTRDVPSPGRGTLVAADIPGAAPASLARASPSSYALGRWPAPAVPQHQFSTGARVTMLKKPQMSAD